MNPKKLVVGLVAAAAGLTILAAILNRDAIHDWLFAIRRVRTWGDLLAQKPIELSDGVIVRLGIEDTRCPQGSGLLLYCLTEGYDPDSFGIHSHHTEGGLGPLEVSVVEEGAILEAQTAEKALGSPRKKTTARLLFARSIPVPRAGKYRVTVSERGKALRCVTVRGTDELTHPLLTLEESGNTSVPRRGSLRGKILPCQGSAAIPAWRGLSPWEADPRIDAAHEFPRLFPDGDARPGLDLRLEGPSLIVTSRSKIRFSSWHFAARWWVNGRPHVSRAPRNRTPSSMVRKGLGRDVEQCRFELDFNAPGIEVRSGDGVSLQLFYSDQGWSLTDGREGFFLLTSKEHRVLQSNRIDLTIP